MEENNVKGKSKFNMSGLIMQHLANMMQMASNCYRNGNIAGWFYEWKNIKFQIIAELDKEERKSLSNKEKEISKLINNKNVVDAVEKIEEYLIEIQDYIKEKEIGLVEKSDETVFT